MTGLGLGEWDESDLQLVAVVRARGDRLDQAQVDLANHLGRASGRRAERGISVS